MAEPRHQRRIRRVSLLLRLSAGLGGLVSFSGLLAWSQEGLFTQLGQAIDETRPWGALVLLVGGLIFTFGTALAGVELLEGHDSWSVKCGRCGKVKHNSECPPEKKERLAEMGYVPHYKRIFTCDGCQEPLPDRAVADERWRDYASGGGLADDVDRDETF